MTENETWRQVSSSIEGVPYWLVFDPRGPFGIDSITLPPPLRPDKPDEEEAELLELARTLVMLERAKKP